MTLLKITPEPRLVDGPGQQELHNLGPGVAHVDGEPLEPGDRVTVDAGVQVSSPTRARVFVAAVKDDTHDRLDALEAQVARLKRGVTQVKKAVKE